MAPDSTAEAVACVVGILTLVVGVVALVTFLRPRPHEPGQKIDLPAQPIELAGLDRLGTADAPVTLMVFSDFECPYCRRFATDVLPRLVTRFVDPGKLQLAFRHLPNTELHPLALRASAAALCGGKQGRFWVVHDALFQGPKLTEQVIERAVMGNDLDRQAMIDCMASEDVAITLRQGVAQARTLRIAATPSLLLGLTKKDGLQAKQWFIGVNNSASLETAIGELVERPR